MKMSQIMIATALASVLALPALPALAQRSSAAHLKGAIKSATADSIVVGTKNGDVTVKLADGAKILTIAKGTIADIKQGAYVGVGATPQPDGSQKAIRVMVFAKSQRGLAEGFRPWNKPGTTMTNATVASSLQSVKSVEGQVMTVQYKGGEKKIVIGPDATILVRTDGSHSDLKPGAAVDVPSPRKQSNGTFVARRVDVGRDGYVP
jgi:hypothetical protein